MTTNPAVAAGLGACTLDQYEFEAETLESAVRLKGYESAPAIGQRGIWVE
ncbi:MAG TPA: hypothetical protein VHO06_21005 [Polyangia bacterium]|nr:hypothetical protein [Polyangia bacterium]